MARRSPLRWGPIEHRAYVRSDKVSLVPGQTDAFIAEVIALHRGRESGSGGVPDGLAKLLPDALGLEPEQTPALADELLDPVNRGRLAEERPPASRLVGAVSNSV
jgi:hypothetical protein